MPKERKDSGSESDGTSSSGEESSRSGSESSHSGSDSSNSVSKKAQNDLIDKTARPDSQVKGTPVKRKTDQESEASSYEDEGVGSDAEIKKAVSGQVPHREAESGELSSSDGEHVSRLGPRSTVIQKMTTADQEIILREGKKESGKKILPKDPDSKEKASEKRPDKDNYNSRKKRSHSQSPRSRDSSKRSKDDGRGDHKSDKGEEGSRQRDERDGKETDRRKDRIDDRSRNSDKNYDDRRRDTGYSRGRDHQKEESRRGDKRDDRQDGRRRDRDGTRHKYGEEDRNGEKDHKNKDEKNVRHQNGKENTEENISRKRKPEEISDKEKEDANLAQEKKAKVVGDELLTSRTGGAYIPPAKLRMMQAQIKDKSSIAYQRMAWEALKKSVNGLINKVNVSNIIEIVRELFQENLVRGRGLLARSITQAQAASPTFTHVYAALVAIINTKFPQNGELILQRLILQFKRGFRRNDKNQCLSSTRFIAHLVNQQVAHEVIALEILTLLLENATEDSVEVAISFLKECGQKLTEVSPRGINAIFERLRNILHEGHLDKRVQYMVEVMFAIRKDGFKDHLAVISDLDLVEEDDQFTHLLTLEDVTNAQDQLNVFKADPDYLENEEKYKTLKKEILAEGSSDEEGSGDESGSDSSSDDDEEEEDGEKQVIVDNTETNMVLLRRTLYLTFQSSLDFEECAHKVLKMQLKPGQEVELCYMILDCCAQLRTYEKFYGLLAQRFCQIEKKYVDPFQNIFREQFETVHRLDTNKLRNVAKFFAHLLYTDAISWGVLSCMKLTEEDTTSASRIFIKILFLELSEYMGLPKLNNRLRDPTLREYFEGILPRNNPKDTRFAINFFTTIGLGGLTEDLREHLKGISKQLMQQKQQHEQEQLQQQPSSSSSDSSESSSSGSDSSDSSQSDSSDSESSSDSDSSESSSDSDVNQKKRKRVELSPKKRDRTANNNLQKHLTRREQPRTSRDGNEGRHRNLNMNGDLRDERRPRIEDKLLKLSLDGDASVVNFSAPLMEKRKRGGMRQIMKRGPRMKRNPHRNRRLSNSDSIARHRNNSECEPRTNRSFERQNSDHNRDGDFRRDDRNARDDVYRGRYLSQDMMDVRRDRPHLENDEMLVDRHGWGKVLERSPRGGYRRDIFTDRLDFREDIRSPRRGDRRDAESPPHLKNRRDVESPPLRIDRRSLEELPPSRSMRDMDIPHQRGMRGIESPPFPRDMRDLDSPLHHRERREMDSPNRQRDKKYGKSCAQESFSSKRYEKYGQTNTPRK